MTLAIETGTRFGSLVTAGLPHLGEVGAQRNGRPRRGSFIEVRCDCGTVKVVRCNDLRSGRTKTCGEGIHVRNRRHGLHNTRTYSCWTNMVQRCNNPKYPKYDLWGGRGITITERWRSFKNFFADMGECPERRSLDRINNDGDYEPGNCRWATYSEQARNRRRRR